MSGEHSHATPIAIIGLAGLFPQAADLRQYWTNIVAQRDCIEDVPANRWAIDDYYDPDPSAPDKTYSKRGGFIPDVPFDPLEFGMPPNILEVTDVSQLLGLVAARRALTDAGYADASAELRERTGVILGVCGGQKLYTPLTARLQYPVWERALRASGISEDETATIIARIKSAYIGWEENSFPGMLGNVIAGRIANRLDLGGLNCVVDAACASGLAALRMAVSELEMGRVDMMITGGVDTDNSPFIYLCFSKTPAFSKSGTPRPFDATADGMAVGEGVGMLVLKRLADAERDGDRVYAVIRGIGASSDGRFRSIYAPRAEGQELSLRRAYADAGVSPASIDLVEAHGTGTVAGDQTEFAALARVFGEAGNERRIALGSVKSQIGHTKATAGTAGLIKAALALHHRVLPATINVENPHPKFAIETTPFYINSETRPWMRRAEHPRRAAVSAFGFGGTNYHIVLEEYGDDLAPHQRLNASAQSVLLAAATPQALADRCDALAGELRTAPATFAALVADRPAADLPRIGFVASSAAEAQELLGLAASALRERADAAEWRLPRGVFYRRAALDGKVAALFPGQGSQYVNMGREAAVNTPEVRLAFGLLERHFRDSEGRTLASIVYPQPGTDAAAATAALQRTDRAQPAIGALSAGLYRTLANAGFAPDVLAGHSFGELTALWAAGTLDDETFGSLVNARGRAMAPPADASTSFDPGAMLAVSGDAARVAELVRSHEGVWIANHNTPEQVVLGGTTQAIASARAMLTEHGFRATVLPVAAAFHTPLVGHAQRPFAEFVGRATFGAAQLPVYANTTGDVYPTEPLAAARMLAGQLMQPVRFQQQVEAMYAAGVRIFVEVGPRNVLCGLVSATLRDRAHVCIATNPGRGDADRQLREALVHLAVVGVPVSLIDTYLVNSAADPKPRGPVVMINGGNFVSEKTRAAYIASHSVAPQAAEPPVQEAVMPQPESVKTDVVQPQFDTHRVFLETQAEYARLFGQLAQKQLELLATGADAATLQSLSSGLERFHSHQQETIRLHNLYLSGHGDTTTAAQRAAPLQDSPRVAVALQEQEPAHVAAALQEPARVAAALQEQEPARVAVNGVHQHNGHASASAPAPQAAPPQVITTPIPAAVDEPAWPAPAEDAVTFAPYFGGHGGTPAPQHAAPLHESVPVATPASAAALQTLAPTTVPAQDSAAQYAAPLLAALVAVVAEKTGYPAETLAADMDLEADLGVDSIKRVEILGALQERYPALPRLGPEQAGELRTLGQIVAFLAPVGAVGAHRDASLPAPATPAPAQDTAQHAAPLPAHAAGAQHTAPLLAALVAVVAEKTGYPAETLDADMDLEADLGVDSIKRVEILGALQERHPALPRLGPEQAGELRTLGQIVAFLAPASAVGAHRAAPLPAPATPLLAPATATTPVPTQDTAQHAVPLPAPAAGAQHTAPLLAALVAVVAEKTGYPAETLDADMDLEADLGVDSIKRVEILGALQERHPALPKLGPEQAGELRTLGQIVAFLAPAGAVGAHRAAPLPAPATPAATNGHTNGHTNGAVTVKADTGVARSTVTLRQLPPPDQRGFALPAGQVCLVSDDGTTTGVLLAQQLLQMGWSVVLLRFPQSVIAERAMIPTTVGRVALSDMSEEQLAAALRTVAESYGPIGGFIHLQPARGDAAAQQALVRHAFLIAKYLKLPITAAAQQGGGCFLTVSRIDGRLGLGTATTDDALAGGLPGLVKTLRHEWPQVFCRAVDIAPALTPEQAAHRIVAELHDPDRLTIEVGVDAQGRYTLVGA